MKLRVTTGALGIAAAAALSAGALSPAVALTGPTEHTDMGVTGADTMAHLEALSDISLEHADTGYRALGTPGYEASSQYVEQVLEETGIFDVERQTFTVDTQVHGDVALTVDGTAYESAAAVEYTEAADPAIADAPVVLPTDDAYGDGAGGELGCAASDFPDMAADAIVVISRGECTFADKVAAATEAGAAAAVIYNNEDGPLNGTLGERMEGSVPAIGLSGEDGTALVEAMTAEGGEGVTGDFTLETEFKTIETWNIIADTKEGDPDRTQVLGAHLDSVPEGPGVNDNASGVAALLAVADGLAEQETPVDNRVRIGIWGAEEVGLVGSYEYVAALSDTEVAQIESYLNYDMIGSENFIVGTLDSDGSDVPVPDGVNVPEGSAELEKIFTDFFDEQDQPHVGTEFSGRSDYAAFLEADIPVSGLFSGADGSKTAEEVEMFGGTEGAYYDRNYHTPDDTIENVNRESVDIFSPAIAYAAHVLAYELREEDPTPDPTEDPTDDPTEEPTEDPTSPAPDPTDDPSEPAPGEDPSDPAPKPGDDGRDDDDSALPRTGSDMMPFLGAGAALVLGGLALVGAARARRQG